MELDLISNPLQICVYLSSSVSNNYHKNIIHSIYKMNILKLDF